MFAIYRPPPLSGRWRTMWYHIVPCAHPMAHLASPLIGANFWGLGKSQKTGSLACSAGWDTTLTNECSLGYLQLGQFRQYAVNLIQRLSRLTRIFAEAIDQQSAKCHKASLASN